MTERRRSAWPLVGAGLVLVVGIVAAAALWLLSNRRYDDNVAAFARAPVGCDTTLDFDRTGEFVLYLETTGDIGSIEGDCELEPSYDRAPQGLPRPALTLVDPDGDDLALEPTGGVDYDTGAFVGTAYRLVEVESTGAHVLTVSSTEGTPYAIAVGGDPGSGVAALRWGALAAVLVALTTAGVLLAAGTRRPPRPRPEPSNQDPWRPTTPIDPLLPGWPAGPPSFPPPGAAGPSGPPTHGTPWAPPPPPSH